MASEEGGEGLGEEARGAEGPATPQIDADLEKGQWNGPGTSMGFSPHPRPRFAYKRASLAVAERFNESLHSR